MIYLVYNISAIFIIFSLFVGIYRLILGPGILNRILAFDLMALCIIAITVLFSLISGIYDFLEIILVFCLLGFATTIAFMDTLFRSMKKEED